MSEILALLVTGTLAASVGSAIAIVLRTYVCNQFGAKAAYHLWLLVPAAILGSFLPFPYGPVSTMVPRAGAAITQAQMAWASAPKGGATQYANAVLVVWVIGVLLSLLQVFVSQRRFVRLANLGLAGPAVVGVALPRMVLPADFEVRFSAEERRMILTHERVHLARGDAAVSGLIALIGCLQWFNPVVWVAGHLARLDQELACDAQVVSQFPTKRHVYARAMLKTQNTAVSLPLGCSWPARSIHPLEERIMMLKRNQPSKS